MTKEEILAMSTEQFIREYGSHTGVRVVKKGHPTIQRFWHEFPTVKDLVSARPSKLCYQLGGDKVSRNLIRALENLLEEHGLYFGILPPKKV